MGRSVSRAILAMAWMATALLLLPGSACAEWVERPDAMHWHRLADFDEFQGRVRVLYYTQPSLAQSANPGWTINAYIAELYPDGRVENRRLASGQRHFEALLLQRGGDGVFAVIAPGEAGARKSVEYWSAQDGSVRGVWYSTALDSTVPGIFPTDDGNFFVVNQSAMSSRGDQPTTLTLIKLSPQGDILAQGEWSNPTAVSSVGGAFPVPGGGMGLSVNMRLLKGGHALDTDIEAVQQFEIGGRAIEARVFSETRLLAAAADGTIQWLSPALERDLMWDGDMSIPQDLPTDERLAQSNEQMALMARVRLENQGDRSLEHLATAGYDDIQKTPTGYGMLAGVTADRRLQPPQHGTWFVEVGDDGSLLRQLRIEPAAERLEAKFERFMPTADGGLLVAGIRRAEGGHLHLTALDGGGTVEWTARLQAQNSKLEGIAGTRSAPWVFGHGFNEAGNKNLLWVELVDPVSAQTLAAEASAAPPTPQPRPRAMPETAAPPTLELPEPAQGCSCSCEEFEKIQEISRAMKSASQAEVLSMVSDPAYQAMMNCMGGCAMQYASCR